MHQEPHEILAGSKASARRCALLCVNHPFPRPPPDPRGGQPDRSSSQAQLPQSRRQTPLCSAWARGSPGSVCRDIARRKRACYGLDRQTPHNVSTILSTSWVHPEQMPRCCQSPAGQAEDPTGMWNRGRREGLTLELNFHKTLLSPVLSF